MRQHSSLALCVAVRVAVCVAVCVAERVAVCVAVCVAVSSLCVLQCVLQRVSECVLQRVLHPLYGHAATRCNTHYYQPLVILDPLDAPTRSMTTG